MKIAHFIEYFQPDLGYQEYSLARQQTVAGHDVKVFTSNYKLVPDTDGRDGLQLTKVATGEAIEHGVSTVRLPSWFSVRPICPVKGLEKALIEFDPDAVHVHGLYYGWNSRAILRAKNKSGFTLLVDDHAMPSNTNLKNRLPKRMHYELVFKRWIWPKLKAATDHFVPVGSEERKFFSEHTGHVGNNVSVIQLGADLELFSRDENAGRKVKACLGIPESSTIAVHAGKLTARKEPEVLLHAWKKVMSTHENARLLMVCGTDGTYINKLKNIAKSLNIDGSVVWSPLVPNADLPAYLSAADFGVWPGDKSAVVQEAVSCALPIILASVESGGHEVNARNLAGENGLFFTRGDADSLASMISTLLDDPALRDRMSKNAIVHAKNEFDWRHISEQFVKLYEN